MADDRSGPERIPWEGAPRPPRRWQAEALPRVIAALESGTRGVVSAFMGGGKSILAAEVVHQWLGSLADDEVVVVGAPRRKLVRQLADTVSERCGAQRVGAFYTDAKEADAEVVVACYASALQLAGLLAEQGRRVALLVADECHQTEAASVLEAFEALQPAAAVGFTATPFRSTRAERLSLWDEVVYRYTYSDGLADRVVTGFQVVNWSGLGAADVDQICLAQIRAYGEGPGIVSALSIEDAESYASLLSEQGIAAAAIHSRQGEPEQARLISELQAGRLSALVHVSLLAEGVDLPWLRWLCLRRPVQSKVRFVQELGRVLRAHPDKVDAVVMDPHDLLGKHGIQHAARLSDALLDEPEIQHDRARGEGPRELRALAMPPAVAVGGVLVYLRRIAAELERVGLPPLSRFDSSHWHDDAPSDRQLRAMARYAWAATFLPPDHRDPLQRLLAPEVAASLSKLAASELIGILLTIKEAWRVWKAAATGGRFSLPPMALGAVPTAELGRLGVRPALPPPPPVGEVTDEHPPASRAWLDRLPHEPRAEASALFEQAIARHEGAQPRQLCREVFAVVRDRLREHDDPQLLQIRDALLAHLQEAMAFAEDRRRWIEQEVAARRKLKERKARAYRRRFLLPPGGAEG